jgi:diacylglycerol O-acyltransferase/trehalose O-mycolyltransferase
MKPDIQRVLGATPQPSAPAAPVAAAASNGG